MNQQHNVKGYELRECLGKGGFGEVYKAWQPTIGREVAIKIILPGLANQPDFIRRFESEAQLVARLEHPYITPLYDYWRDPNGAYLVMRCLRGGNLRDALQHGPFELTAATLLLDQIAGALSLAHRNAVIHRDIKPENILLDDDGNAYLTDFGIAKDLNLPTNHTREDMIVGSLDYISPEQARSEPVTPRTDIYSLGVTLFEAITGHHPFENISSIERLYKHINDPLPEIDTIAPNLQEAVNRVIQKATAKNPEQRYADALALAADFREAIGMNRSSTTIEELLTQREHEILQLIVDGLSNKEIAQRLTLTLGTVKWHVNQIYSKLGVRSRVQAIVRARELNLIVKPGETIALVSIPTEDFRPRNPYKGLLAFQSADNQDFFGREKLIAKLINRLSEAGDYRRFLAVVGPSGSGKSSLVKAGLIPALWRGELPGSEKWFVAEMLPGAHPLDELEVALTRVAANQSGNLNEQLRRDHRGLVRVAGIILPQDETELVLVIDQFEEVFTLLENETERTQFLDLLYTAVTEPRSRLRIIITLRADFYDRPLYYPQFGELVRTRLETIMPLSAAELERAIVLPAEHVGVTFEPGLVAAVIGDVNYQPGALPLLQYALTELFEQRKGRLLLREAYQEIGGTVGALAKRAEDIYLSLSDSDQELTRQIFLRLVTLGEGTEDTRRRTLRSELLGIQQDIEPIEELLDSFAAYRLLSLDNEAGSRQPTVEIAHEALIREWERLKAWLNESRTEIQMQRQLSTQASDWAKSKQNPSFLLRLSRLDDFEAWAQKTSFSLTPEENRFLQASLHERKREQQAEAERQAREKRIEQRSRNFLRGLVAVFAVATVITASLSVLALWLNNQSQRNSAEFRSIALTFGAQDALNHHQPDVALALAREAVNISQPPLQSQLMFYNAASSTWIQHRYLASATRIWDAVYHPDGKRIITTSWDGRAVIWDIDTERELQSIQADGRLWDIAVHPNGHIIALGGDNGILRLWDTETNEITELVAGDDSQKAPVFNHDGTQLITTNAGTIYIWNLETLELTRSFEAHDSGLVPAVHFSPDERLLISSGLIDGLVKIWDVETGELVQTLDHRMANMDVPWVWDGLFVDDGERVLTAGGGLLLWNWRTNERIWSAEEPNGVQDIALSPDNQTFVVGLGDGTAKLRNLETGNLLHVYDGHSLRIQNVDYSPDGSSVLTGSNDGTAIVWPVNWEGALRTTLVHSYVIAWHPTRPLLAAVGVSSDDTVDGTIRLIDTQSGEVVREIVGHREMVASLAFTPDGRYLFSGDQAPSFDQNNQRVYVWDIETGEQVLVLDGQVGWIYSIAFSPDGQVVAISEALGSRIILRDVATGERIKELEGHQDWVNEVLFSPDGQYLYSAGRDGALMQWDVQTGTIVRHFAGHPGSIIDIDLNPDGTRLVSASTDETAIVWDTSTGAPVMTLRGHTDSVWSADFSPDGSTILTASSDGKIILWDAQTGARLQTYVATNDTDYLIAAFSPDGQEIASAANDIVTFWDATPLPGSLDSWIAANRYIPDFTCEQRALYRIEPVCVDEATQP